LKIITYLFGANIKIVGEAGTVTTLMESYFNFIKAPFVIEVTSIGFVSKE
jgi:hypothetical protein